MNKLTPRWTLKENFWVFLELINEQGESIDACLYNEKTPNIDMQLGRLNDTWRKKWESQGYTIVNLFALNKLGIKKESRI